MVLAFATSPACELVFRPEKVDLDQPQQAAHPAGALVASYVARAVVYGADNGAKVLNLSVAGPGFPQVVQDAVDYAESKGVMIIMAVGNHAEDIDNASPNRLRRVMAVAATDPDDKRAAFSNKADSTNQNA